MQPIISKHLSDNKNNLSHNIVESVYKSRIWLQKTLTIMKLLEDWTKTKIEDSLWYIIRTHNKTAIKNCYSINKYLLVHKTPNQTLDLYTAYDLTGRSIIEFVYIRLTIIISSYGMSRSCKPLDKNIRLVFHL